MSKTANSYVNDRGELTITISAADVAAMAAFTTAETITLDGVVIKFEETSPKTREYAETYVAGDSAPIKTMNSKQTSTVWTLLIVDDYAKGSAGEWGTDLLTAVEIFQAFFDAGRTISKMSVTPAGSTTGMIETTLTNVDVQSMPNPGIDTSRNAPAERSITLVVESDADAAHA